MNPLIDDILGQPESLRRLIEHHLGPGRDALARAAAEIRHARQVIFSGMGSSLFAAMPGVALLNAHGRATCSMEASEFLYYYRAIHRDTLVVLVSRSGETVEVVKLIPLLRKKGVRIIGVTNVPGSTLAAQSDIAIHVTSAPDRLIALRTYTGTVATLLLLASQATGQPTPPLAELPAFMQSVVDTQMETPQPFWSPDNRLYVLGRGPSLGSAHEGALLFHETARTPATPMSCAAFRHGPVEVISSQIRAFIFATQPETRALDEQLGEDLRILGTMVKVISIPHLEGPWACVFEVIPIQFAAVRLAESRGVPPASFQFSPAVTVDETGFENPATNP